MDNPLKRRLLGAVILLATAFILASLLPEPRLQATGEEDLKVVTVDLHATPAPVAEVTPTPLEVIDPTVAAPEADESTSAEGGAPEISAEAQAPDADDYGATALPAATAAPKPSAAATAMPTSKPTAKPTLAPTAPPTQKPTPLPTLKPTPVPTPLPTAAPTPLPSAKPLPTVASAAAAASTDGDRWWVQIGSYSDITNAREGESRLKALGIPVFIAPIDSPNGILYRVRGGPYSDKANGEKALAAVLKDGFADARLVHP